MASSSFLERKLKKLNCIKGQQFYGSLDSLNTIDSARISADSEPRKQFKLFGRFGKKSKTSKADQFTVSYEHVLEHEDADEKTGLLESSAINKKKKRYSNIGDVTDNPESSKKNKKSKKSVKFSPVDISETGQSSRDKKNKKKKKSSLLKRTGKMIVRTCRLMSYGTPYMTHMSGDFPYNTRYPPDYRYYDFETKQYDFGYSNNYMGYSGYSPSVFF